MSSSTPAFSCGCPSSLSRRNLPHSFRPPQTLHHAPARRYRPRCVSLSASQSDEDPTELAPPPIAPTTTPPWSLPNPPRRNPSVSRPSISHTSLPHLSSPNFSVSAHDARPSPASLRRYMDELQPKLDYLTPDARLCVLYALEVANDAHHGQLRKSGDPFIMHPIAVAQILADMRMDRDCVVAGLLHDTVEDTPVTLQQLEAWFGRDVRKIVEGETKLSKLAKKVHCEKKKSNLSPSSTPDSNPVIGTAEASASHTTRVPSWQTERQKREDEQQKQADNLRAMFKAMTEDVRVIIVKLADRLHNMRTLAHMSLEKRKKISKETLEFFAPLAHRLGMRRIKLELEELSFMYLRPDEYHHLKYEVETMLSRSKFNYYLKSAEVIVRDELEQDHLLCNMVRSAQVIGTTKELYSVYRRMQAGENLSSMLGIATMRIVLDLDPGVDSNQACYHVLGLIHSMWKPLPTRVKDYIAFPKPNGYQSLHTTVLLGQQFDFFGVEIQIRTAEMHRIAEDGIAAQLFTAKPGPKMFCLNEENDEDSSEWRRRTMGWLVSIREYLEEFSSSKDLIDAVRKDLLGNRVFVFTPKGRIIDLPKHSTPIDLGYRIHSDVGNNMIGAKVNGRTVSLDYKLQNADVVRIISSSSSPGPAADWVGFAKSKTARQKIRRFLRAKDRGNMLDCGRRILEEQARKSFEPIPSEAGLTEIMPRLAIVALAGNGPENLVTVDDLYMAIAKGRGKEGTLPLEKIVLGFLRDRRHSSLSGIPWARPKLAKEKTEDEGDAHIPDETKGKELGNLGDNVEVVLSPCCQPIRGDEVVGVRMQGGQNKAFVVHRTGCHYMAETLEQRSKSKDIVNLRWAVKARSLNDNVIDVERYLEEEEASYGHTTSKCVEEQRGYQPTQVVCVAQDFNGLLSFISGVLASLGTSIRRAVTKTNPQTMLATLAFEVLVRDSYHLRRIVEHLENCDDLLSAHRLGPNESEEYFPDNQFEACHMDGEDDARSLHLLRNGQTISPNELEIEDCDANSQSSRVSQDVEEEKEEEEEEEEEEEL